MYAIVEIAGQQYRAEAGKRLYVHRLEAEQGSVVEFEKVLLVDADGEVKVGVPTVEGAKIVCEVLSHLKGEKVLIFKKKRRKGYRKLNGHRQYLTELKINEVIA
jgi:large subunit ribosomal protein L21